MLLEARTRITLMLPFPTDRNQLAALQTTLDKLLRLCGGITTSILPDLDGEDEPIFQGRWVDPENNKIFNEAAILVMADAAFETTDSEFLENLVALKVKCQHDFDQRVIWLTIHRLDRVASHDYV